MLRYRETSVTYRWYYGIHELHRIGGPAINWKDGANEWFISGRRHRLNGPVFESVSDYRDWSLNDKLHCIEGHAVERADGTREWWVSGVRYAERDFNRIMKIKNAKV